MPHTSNLTEIRMYSDLMNFDGIRSFIIDNELTDSVAIVLHPDNFDALAMNYISITAHWQGPLRFWVLKYLKTPQEK